jgi:hypothetical protein
MALRLLGANPWPSPSERLHRPHRFTLMHIELYVIKKSYTFLGQGANIF